MIQYNLYSRGQALITLLVFVIIASTITAGAVALMIINSASATRSQEGQLAYYVAESGVENGVLQVLRNTSYVGETLPVGDGTAVITVTGTNPKTITSVGTLGNYTRTIRVQMTQSGGYYTFTNWEEIP